MNQANSHRMYNQTKIATANPGTLLLMLYDGAIKFLKIAEGAMEQNELEVVNNNLIKAEAIIIELMSSLKMDVGGEIAKNLFMIYDFMYRTLVEANTKKEKKKVIRVISMLENMKTTWQEVIKKETGKISEKGKEKEITASEKPKGVNIAI